MAEQVEAVRCRNLAGVLIEVELADLGECDSPGSMLTQRFVRETSSGLTLVRKSVSKAAGSRHPQLYDLLDHEVRATSRLGQVFGGRYPSELARIAGYNMDAEEPFALLHEYTGSPVTGLDGHDEVQRRAFQVSLLRALQHTAVAGVVHGAIGPDSVRWDGKGVQLVDFEHAELAGEPRRRGWNLPMRSPEQSAGVGVVDIRDDLWAAGLLIRRVALNIPPGGVWPDRQHDPALLRALLDPIFANPAEARPTPEDLLRRLRANSQVAWFTDPDAALGEWRALFDQVSAGKLGPAAVLTPTNGAPVPRSARRLWKLPFLVTMVLAATMIILAAVRL